MVGINIISRFGLAISCDIYGYFHGWCYFTLAHGLMSKLTNTSAGLPIAINAVIILVWFVGCGIIVLLYILKLHPDCHV